MAPALAVLNEFSALHLQYASRNDTSGQWTNITANFDVVSSTSTYVKANVTETISPNTISYLFKVEKSGTVDWVYSSVGGYKFNTTNSAQATSSFIGAMAFFELEANTNPAYQYALLTTYFHQVGGTNSLLMTNAATGQSVRVDYQTYEENSPNESFGYCGSSYTLSTFTIEIGTVGSTSTQVLASLVMKGNINGQNLDVAITLSWVQVAS